MANGLAAYFNTFIDFIYPRHCFSCDNTINCEMEMFVCKACRDKIINTNEKNCCIRCGLDLGPYSVIPDFGCISCKNLELWFDAIHSIAGYEGPTKQLIHKFKYGRNEVLKMPIGSIMTKCYGLNNFIKQTDLIVPIPLFWRKRIKRGFNQSELIAKQLAKHYSIPTSINNLRRIRNTDTQAHLTRTQRIKNVENAFSVKIPKKFSQKKILLVDDVMTTGVTASECARMLKKSDAMQVYVIVFARAQIK